MANYFIADTHFGHKNILSYDARLFKSVEEHDEHLIKCWNDAVSYDDDVYILGDISWHNSTKTNEILDSLNGTKHLIIGNHDKKLLKNREFQNRFQEITSYKELPCDNGKGCLVLCHYPIPCFNGHYYGDFHLYGHVHNGWEWNIMKQVKFQMEELYLKPCNMYNVGVMIPYMNYTPRTLEEIIEGERNDRILHKDVSGCTEPGEAV